MSILVRRYFQENYFPLLFFVFCCLLAFLLVALQSLSCTFPDENVPKNEFRSLDDLKLICYYAFPGSGDDLVPEQIPETLCTHIILAFAGINQTDYSLNVSQNDTEVILKLSLLKTKNKNLKVMISVGGAGCNDFPQMVQNHSNRKMFINSTMRFIKTYKLDGVDIDWEWPNSDGNAKEKIKFVQLLQETRLEFDRHKKKYLLSIAAGALQSQVEIFYYVNYIKEYVDFINLMTYDYHYYTSYYPVTDYNAPLYASAKDADVFSQYNVNFSVNYWISKSVPRHKLILGIPAYGHTYLLRSSLNHDLHAPASGFGNVGQNGFIKYLEVCDFLSLSNTFHVQDDDSNVPYAYNRYDWISYDDEYSVGIKAEYVVKEKLGGAMVYSLNAEDFLGKCRSDKMKFPLITKIRSIFNGHSTRNAGDYTKRQIIPCTGNAAKLWPFR